MRLQVADMMTMEDVDSEIVNKVKDTIVDLYHQIIVPGAKRLERDVNLWKNLSVEEFDSLYGFYMTFDERRSSFLAEQILNSKTIEGMRSIYKGLVESHVEIAKIGNLDLGPNWKEQMAKNADGIFRTSYELVYNEKLV